MKLLQIFRAQKGFKSFKIPVPINGKKRIYVSGMSVTVLSHSIYLLPCLISIHIVLIDMDSIGKTNIA